MERVRTPLVIYQGEDLEFEVTWLDEEGGLVGLEGYTAHAQVRLTYWKEDVILDFRSDGAGSGSGDDGLEGTIDLTEGTITLHATAAVTSAVVMPSDGVYDVELTDGDGEVYRVAAGPVELSREVTR